MRDNIGGTAGKVWRFLEEEGENSLTAINDGVDEARSQVMMAIGWLAKEGKVDFDDEGRGVSVNLK